MCVCVQGAVKTVGGLMAMGMNTQTHDDYHGSAHRGIIKLGRFQIKLNKPG